MCGGRKYPLSGPTANAAASKPAPVSASLWSDPECMDRATLHRASPNPPRGASAARQGLNKVPSGHENKSSARLQADRRHEKLNTMTTSQVSGSGPHTYNVSGLDRANWKPDPRNAGRSSGRNDRSGSWQNERTAPPTTRNSVDEMSDDAFADMMKKYAADNFGSMFRRHCDMSQPGFSGRAHFFCLALSGYRPKHRRPVLRFHVLALAMD